MTSSLAAPCVAQGAGTPSINLFGLVGAIDMPSGEPLPDAEIALNIVRMGSTLRTGFTFQITPRLSGGFRYAIIKGFDGAGTVTRYDRSFDVAYQLAFEGRYRPAIKVGLQDFGGTGIYSGEYLAFTKTLREDVTVTAGIGWGRFGGYNSFKNPLGVLSDRFDTRDTDLFDVENAGKVNAGNWFQGDAAIFGSAVWRTPVKGLTAKLEYSSDDYSIEVARNVMKHKTPVNLGVEYQFANGASLGLYSMYGSEIALKFSTSINPKRPLSPTRDRAPLPIQPRKSPYKVQQNVFGTVIDSTQTKGGFTGTLPKVAIARTQTGVRIGTVNGACNASVARELDAEQGALDLVVFETSNGARSCTVALRPAGLSYIENLSKRPVMNQITAPSLRRADSSVQSNLSDLLRSQGIVLESYSQTNSVAYVSIRNLRYGAAAQSIGRTARAMTAALPANVETFVISGVESAMAVNRVTLARRDLEELEYEPDNVWLSFVRANIDDADLGRDTPVDGIYPKFYGSVGPYTEANIFDPDNPLRIDAGLQFSGSLEVLPGLSFNGHARSKLVGNVDEVKRPSNSSLTRVRTDIDKYQINQGAVRLDRLTMDYFFKVKPTIYGRVQAGVLERMYSGVAGELLWKPVESDLGLGVELAYVRQRDFDGKFGLRDFSTVTGHASLYYTMANDFRLQVDAGRYLAGDVGATVSLDRTFKNGWEAGAYATITNVSSDDFGEGSFDKGLRFRIPLSWLNGAPSRNKYSVGIQPVQRDGGARLNLSGRLHPVVRASDQRALIQSWGKFWR